MFAGRICSVIWILLFPVCLAGDYCLKNNYLSYCYFGCCYYQYSGCCNANIGLIVGLCISGAVAITVAVIIICVCRRRRYRGHVYQNQPAMTALQQSTVITQQGGVVTSGVQPGVIYPPNPNYPAYPPNYPAYPPNYGYANPPNNGTGYSNVPAYPPQPMPYEATSHSQNQNQLKVN